MMETETCSEPLFIDFPHGITSLTLQTTANVIEKKACFEIMEPKLENLFYLCHKYFES